MFFHKDLIYKVISCGTKGNHFYLILMYLHCKNQNVVNKGLLFAFSNVYDRFLLVSVLDLHFVSTT